MTEFVHKFEACGLGKAPFAFIGMEEKVHAIPGGNSKPGGTCCYCSTGIKYCFWLESADGQKFYVGSECIKKSGDSGLMAKLSEHEKAERAAKAAKGRAAKAAKRQARLEAAAVKAASGFAEYAGKPHPNSSHASRGLTFADYLYWLWNNGFKDKAASLIN